MSYWFGINALRTDGAHCLGDGVYWGNECADVADEFVYEM